MLDHSGMFSVQITEFTAYTSDLALHANFNPGTTSGI